MVRSTQYSISTQRERLKHLAAEKIIYNSLSVPESFMKERGKDDTVINT